MKGIEGRREAGSRPTGSREKRDDGHVRGGGEGFPCEETPASAEHAEGGLRGRRIDRSHVPVAQPRVEIGRVIADGGIRRRVGVGRDAARGETPVPEVAPGVVGEIGRAREQSRPQERRGEEDEKRVGVPRCG